MRNNEGAEETRCDIQANHSVIKDFIAGHTVSGFDARETTNLRFAYIAHSEKKAANLPEKSATAKNRATQAWPGNANAMACARGRARP